MKKNLKYIAKISLIIISIIITNQTTIIIKENDKIMKEIEEKKEKYQIPPIDAIIIGDTIIPGLNGRKVNINKTYIKMKKTGNYNPKYYMYEEIKPKKSINKIYDKYIQKGNNKIKKVSLIIIINKESDLKQIIEIIKNQEIKVTFLINNIDLSKIKYFTLKKLNEKYTILNFKNNQQKYCYTEEKEKKLLMECANKKIHTIKPYVIDNNLILETKKIISNGSIISIHINNNTTNELELAINYIKNKGYKIVKLEELLSEKNIN